MGLERNAGHRSPVLYRDMDAHRRAAIVARMGSRPDSERVCVRCMAPGSTIIFRDGKCGSRYCDACARMARAGRTTEADMKRIRLSRMRAALERR
jgi:hypothetical protein